jgi:hypothetical protein
LPPRHSYPGRCGFALSGQAPLQDFHQIDDVLLRCSRLNGSRWLLRLFLAELLHEYRAIAILQIGGIEVLGFSLEDVLGGRTPALGRYLFEGRALRSAQPLVLCL